MVPLSEPDSNLKSVVLAGARGRSTARCGCALADCQRHAQSAVLSPKEDGAWASQVRVGLCGEMATEQLTAVSPPCRGGLSWAGDGARQSPRARLGPSSSWAPETEETGPGPGPAILIVNRARWQKQQAAPFRPGPRSCFRVEAGSARVRASAAGPCGGAGLPATSRWKL